MNSAVNRIREALGDKASNPRFVETLARRGYRFIAPVERLGSPESDPIAEVSEAPAVLPDSAPGGLLDQLLSRPEDLPESSHRVVQTLFLLLQVMYLGFYIGALANLQEIHELISPLPVAALVFTILIVTASVQIPVRTYLLCAVLFRAPRFREKFLRLWRLLLPLDCLWALSPFLLLHHINSGLALACVALLVYSPFAQRSLILMGAAEANKKRPRT
jgi:hypothetical protein